MKTNYKISKKDQPTLTTTIYAAATFLIKDYGLEGDYPLKQLYENV